MYKTFCIQSAVLIPAPRLIHIIARAISKQAMPDREGVLITAYAGSLRVIAADAITDNGMRLAELEPHLKERLRKILPDYVCDMNPDVIKTEKAGIPVFSAPVQVADALAIIQRHQIRVEKERSQD